MPSVWLRVKAEVQLHVTGWCIWSYGIWLWYILCGYGVSSLTLFPLLPRTSPSPLLSLLQPHLPFTVTLNSPVTLLLSHCTCSSLLEMFSLQTSSRKTAVSFKSLFKIFYLECNTLVTDISNALHLIIFPFGTIMQLTVH